MKAVHVLLLLCLIASFECEDIIAKIICLAGNSSVLDTIKEVVRRIKEKQNAIEIALFLVSKYEPIKQAIEQCFK